jgi:NADPH:quinone reductase-like Zn-dependent oxidoreductase
MKAIQLQEFGGPDVLEHVEVDDPAPGEGEVLLARPDLAIPMIGELLGAVAAGELEATIGEVYPLSEASRAHEDLIARRSSGKLLLDPST